MNKELIEELKKRDKDNADKQEYVRLNKFSNYMNEKFFDGNRLHDVKGIVTFYYYVKNNDNYSKYSNQYKDTFSKRLNEVYSSKQIVETDFNDFMSDDTDFLDTMIELSSDELAQRIADVAKDKAKATNDFSVYNKIDELVKKHGKNVKMDYSFLNDALNVNNDNKESYNIDDAIKSVQSALQDVNNVEKVEPKPIEIAVEPLADVVARAKQKIDSMSSSVTENADSNDATQPEKQEEKTATNFDFSGFEKSTINNRADYDKARAEIEEKMRNLNMEQRRIERENKERMDQMVSSKAEELGVSEKALRSKLDKSDISIDEIDKIVISPDMQSRVAANEAVAQLPKSTFIKIVDRVFSNAKLKKSDLEIGEINQENVVNISIDTSKSQKISSMEKKIYEKIVKSSMRKQKIGKFFTNTEQGVKKAIKSVFKKMKDTDLKNRQWISNKLYDLGDRIYSPQQEDNVDDYNENLDYEKSSKTM